jgi:tellurite resistance protein TehA-like permease
MAAMMFDRIIGDVRRAASTEMRLIAIGGAASLAAAATLSLLCAAPFVFVMDRYNILYACLTVAGIWLILTLTLLAIYAATRRQAERASIAAHATRRSLLADPFVIASAVQIVQALGIKRVVALLAVAGTAMAPASKPASRGRPEPPAKP